MNVRRHLYLFPLALFLILICSESVERSMYTDGVAYASIAKNLAHGIGSFWYPSLSETINPVFHGHPPLVFGLQSLFFRLLGDGLATERIYALVIFLLSGWVMVLLWREVFRASDGLKALWFYPLTLWIINEVVYHFYPANVLEPTAGLFALLAIYFCTLSTRPLLETLQRSILIILAGIFVVAGLLSKGPVVLFPVLFFVFYYFSFGNPTIRKVLRRTGILFGVTLAGSGLLLLLPGAAEALWAYFELQIKASVLAENTTYHYRNNRFYIIRRTFEILIPALLIGGLLLALAYGKVRSIPWTMEQKRWALLFLFIGLSASIPLAISPKQAYYYLLPAMPYFALSIGIISVQPVRDFVNRKAGKIENGLLASVLTGLLFFAAYNTYQHWGEITRRDKSVLTDIERVNSQLPEKTIIAGKGKIAPLVSYMYRLKSISIDTARATMEERKFLVAPDTVVIDAAYQLVETGAVNYVLYRRTSE